MAVPMSKGVRAPAEQLYRAVIKHFFLNQEPANDAPLPAGRLKHERLLPPYFGEMGFEIRYHLAQVEPWLRHGWKIVTRRPAFYPEGSAIAAPEFFAAADQVLASYGVVSSHGGLHIPPLESGDIGIDHRFDSKTGTITVHLSEIRKVTTQALAEIAIRRLFLEWFHSDSRKLLDFDRFQLSFLGSAIGNWEYRIGVAVPPSFQPPSFVTPPEPVAPHVGVQMRNVVNGVQQNRNSDPEWMLAKAQEIAAHLGLDLLVYGHPGGCIIPAGHRTTWDAARPDGHMARELGTLKSCCIMLAPNSGWADLMAWLQIPALLEGAGKPGTFEPLRDCFQPRLAVLDRGAPAGPQADALIAATGCVLPDDGAPPLVDPRLFPWEP
ncbi:MAG TPA: hypothetical protein VH019_05045 [Rhizomicrobium sp.]|nr:hypothetical protein [Rhizomicrobium sp.]